MTWCQGLVLKYLPREGKVVTSSQLTGKNSIASDLIFKSSSYERLGVGLSIAILAQFFMSILQFNPR
jgi:hypothetical protein